MDPNQAYNSRVQHSNPDGDEALQGLRRPMPETQARLLHGSPAAHHQMQGMSHRMMNSNSDRYSSTSLRVSAPEFVPRFPMYGVPPNQVLSVGAAEFIPRIDIPPPMMPNFGPSQYYYPQIPPPPLPPPPQPVAPQENFVNNFNQMTIGPDGGGGGGLGGGGGGGGGRDQMLMYEFSETVMMLTTCPGNYTEYLKPLCEKIKYCQSPEVFNSIISCLYEQCIYEPNFRYTGARVLQFLCRELQGHQIFGNFKRDFLNKCQGDFERREQLIGSGTNGELNICGLALFMGELFLNVTAEAKGQSEQLTFLPGALTDLLLTLVNHPSDASIKTACQLLKLAGGPTEDAMAKQDPAKFNSVFKFLTVLKDNSKLISKNMQCLIQSVLSQRQNNWGRPDPTQTSNDVHYSGASSIPDFSQNEPVFYNQYGKPVTREEAGFKEEEEDEENFEDFVLTEEEERDFLKWQEESQYPPDLIVAPPVSSGPPVSQHGYGDAPVYPQWSTNDSSAYGAYHEYDEAYDYGYPSYSEEGLQMDDEAEKAYEEFLQSQKR